MELSAAGSRLLRRVRGSKKKSEVEQQSFEGRTVNAEISQIRKTAIEGVADDGVLRKTLVAYSQEIGEVKSDHKIAGTFIVREKDERSDVQLWQVGKKLTAEGYLTNKRQVRPVTCKVRRRTSYGTPSPTFPCDRYRTVRTGQRTQDGRKVGWT